MKQILRSLMGAALVAALFTGVASAQTAPNNTTLSAAVTDSSARFITVASTTGAVANGSFAYIDREVFGITAFNSTSGVLTVTRGLMSTKASTHASGATVVIGMPQIFQPDDLSASGKVTAGSCTSTNELFLPIYNVKTGRRWNCIGSLWMVDNGIAVLPPSACVSSVSGNSTGTNGLTVAGASNTPVMQAQTSNTGTNTHTYVCQLNAAAWSGQTTGIPRNILLIDASLLYGVQTTALGTQVATLASGTMNSVIVFSSIVFPAAGASETPSTVTPVRADAGTLVITPVVASFNTATTTAGGFYTAKFAPATPFAMNTDLKLYLLTVALLNTATSATVTNVAGVLVHFAYIPDL